MSNFSEHKCGWIALLGPPNAGKSTLLNSLLGQKVSIVSSKPQTTRNRIVGILTEPAAQIIFMDTPGINQDRGQSRGHLGKMMHQAAWQSLDNANLIMLVLDSELYIRKPEFLDNDLEKPIAALKTDPRPQIVVVNKIDLFHDKAKMLPLLEHLHKMFPNAEIFPMSAQNKDGVNQLKELLVKNLPAAPAQFPDDQLSTAPVRFMAAEIIREKLFERLRQEVPYSVAVGIDAWEEDEKRGQTVIHATIYVTRASHKAMVIGRAGTMIKEIGTEARKDIQGLTGGKVHLELWVKVKENWSNDPNLLHDLGVGDEA